MPEPSHTLMTLPNASLYVSFISSGVAIKQSHDSEAKLWIRTPLSNPSSATSSLGAPGKAVLYLCFSPQQLGLFCMKSLALFPTEATASCQCPSFPHGVSVPPNGSVPSLVTMLYPPILKNKLLLTLLHQHMFFLLLGSLQQKPEGIVYTLPRCSLEHTLPRLWFLLLPRGPWPPCH